MPPSRRCSSRFGRRPRSRRRSSGSAPRSGVGLLAPQSKLPPERELAEQFGISRSTLRQALTTLVQSGHLTSVRGRSGGTFVAERPPLAEGGPDPLGEDAWAVLDLRLAIEVGSAILAAERAEDRDLDALDALVDRMSSLSSRSDFEPYRRADIRFHIGLAEATHSPRLVTEMTEVQGQMSDLISLIAHPEEVLTRSNAQHARARRAAARARRRRARRRPSASTSAAPSTSSPA